MRNSLVETEINTGTAKDYSEDLYRYYLEVVDQNGAAKNIILKFVGPEKSASIFDRKFGYEFNIPIQCAPEIIKRLSTSNIGVYQLVRIGRVSGQWKNEIKK